MNTNNNPTFSTVTAINNICEPLFTSTPISFFHYFKTYKNFSTVTLTSNGPWLEKFFEDEYYKYSSFCSDPTQYARGYKLTSTFTRSQPIVREAAAGHNIGPGIVMIEPSKAGFCEFYLFCVDTACPSSNEFFLNHIDILKKFIFYFKDKGQSLIEQADKNRIFFNTPELVMPPKEFVSDPYANVGFKTKRYYIDDKNYLTQKETDCIYWLAQGKSCEEIAMLLNNSPRTIENHISNAKFKLDVYKISSLIMRAKELYLI